MFEKKETIYKKKDRETWESIRKVLKEQGIPVFFDGILSCDALKVN